MFLTFESRTPCLVCRYQLRTFLMDYFRVNKRSIRPRGKGKSIGACDRFCPECGTHGAALPTRSTYRLTADGVEKVAAYRLRRWPELAHAARKDVQ